MKMEKIYEFLARSLTKEKKKLAFETAFVVGLP